MNGTQILEPAFHVVSPSLGRADAGSREDRGAGVSAGDFASGLFAMLERLRLCHAPRILSAVCLEAPRADTVGGAVNCPEVHTILHTKA